MPGAGGPARPGPPPLQGGTRGPEPETLLPLRQLPHRGQPRPRPRRGPRHRRVRGRGRESVAAGLHHHRAVRGLPGAALHVRHDRAHRHQEEAKAGREAQGAVPQPPPAVRTGLQVITDTW